MSSKKKINDNLDILCKDIKSTLEAEKVIEKVEDIEQTILDYFLQIFRNK